MWYLSCFKDFRHKRITPSSKQWRLWQCILTGNFSPEFLIAIVRSAILVKAIYFNLKKVVMLSVRSQYKASLSEKLFSENKNCLRNTEKVKQTRNANVMTIITKQKIPYVYTCLSSNINNQGSYPYNSLLSSGLYLTRNQREACTMHLVRQIGEVLRFSCWEKGNFIVVYELTYGKTLNI